MGYFGLPKITQKRLRFLWGVFICNHSSIQIKPYSLIPIGQLARSRYIILVYVYVAEIQRD
jgi:hypothetical protein